MKIQALSTALDGQASLRSAVSKADFVAVHCNCEVDVSALDLGNTEAQIHGATSCLGAMTGAGVTDGLALFAIEDPDGAYGSCLKSFGADPRQAARDATLEALARADRVGEKPELVWVSSTPGVEEAVLEGIQSLTGPDVPIIGGSAADNTVSGDWFVFDGAQTQAAGLVVSVMFPSRPVSFAYHNGYSPTEISGTVTRIEGRRVIEIDNRPAFDVYRDWTNGAVDITADVAAMQSILSESTLAPLGRNVAELDGVASYLLAHPAGADTSGALELFATVEHGETLTLMTGTKTGLVERAGRVAALARAAGRMETSPISGALMVYCGGCMLSVQDRLDEVVGGVAAALGDAPFAGTFTFGEQGPILGAGNRHGNLMISCIVFE